MANTKEYRRQYYLKNKDKILQQGKQYYEEHKAHVAERTKEYHRRNYEKSLIWDQNYKRRHRVELQHRERSRRLRKYYGLTHEQYDQLKQEQDFRCAICGKLVEQLCVDHDHETGRVRGLLCRACNLILGNADDNPNILLSAIDYLGKVAQ